MPDVGSGKAENASFPAVSVYLKKEERRPWREKRGCWEIRYSTLFCGEEREDEVWFSWSFSEEKAETRISALSPFERVV